MPDLVKLIHEFPALAASTTLAFVGAVVLALRNNLIDLVVNSIKKLFRRLFNDHDRNPSASTREEARKAAESLADKLAYRLEREQDYLEVKANRALKVGWREVDHDGNPDSSGKLVGAGRSISAVYEKVPSGRLVILGVSGAGKSFLLQLLASRMLDLPAGANPRVPVIFNLSAWEADARLDGWLARELLRLLYDSGLSENLARGLVKHRLILPILDGFDEIVGADARHSLLKDLSKEEDMPFVLTSRKDEHLKMALATVPEASVIELMDLTPQETAGYLDKFGPAWKPVVQGLLQPRSALATGILAEALKTPLMVALIRDVYWHNPKELIEDKNFASVEEIRHHLLDNFIKVRYGDGLENPPRWRPEKALHFFHCLAVKSEQVGDQGGQQGQGDQQGKRSQEIAWWKIGTAGMTPLRRSLVSGLVGGLVIAFMNGIFSFAAVLGAAGIKISLTYGLEIVSGHAIVVGTAFGLAHWFTIKYKSELLEPSKVTIASFRRMSIRRSRRRGGKSNDDSLAQRFRGGLMIGIISAFVGIFGISVFDAILSGHWFGGGQDGGNITILAGLTLALVFVLGFTLDLGLAMGLISLFMEPMQTRDTATAGPLALLAANRRTMLWGGLTVGIMNGAIMGIIDGMIQGPVLGFAFAVVGGVTVGVGGVLTETAWGQWVIYCRVWLPLKGQLPWRICKFLEDAHQRRGVLRQIGGLYQFRHADLRDSILRADKGTRSS